MEMFFKKIGIKFPTFIIAEISANHGQDFNRAVALIKKAKECGADAVKFQTYTPNTLTIDVDNKYFKVNLGRWRGQTLHQLYKKAYTPYKWFKKLKKIADDIGIVFFSTVFDKSAVDLLEEISVPIHKIASFELIDLPLIEYVAKTKKPLIMSTGMSTVDEVKEAIQTARKAGAKDIALLKCVSSYPAEPEQMNLNTIPEMKKRFKMPIGLSDHTLGNCVASAAVALGASIVEKHFTLSSRIKSPDSFFSIKPKELKELVNNIRIVEKALGKPYFNLSKVEKVSRSYRRSLFVIKDMKKGDIFTEENIRSIRPANGLKPKYFRKVLEKKAKKNIKRGTPLSLDLIC